MAGQGKYIAAGLAAVVVIAGGGYFLINKPHPVAVRPPAATAPVRPARPVAAQTVPTDCLLPGPAPVEPNGEIASEADMKLAHDVIQHFVLELETYQKCRDDQADKTPGATAQQKQGWIAQGDAAIDQANELAKKFSVQLKIYKSRHTG